MLRMLLRFPKGIFDGAHQSLLTRCRWDARLWQDSFSVIRARVPLPELAVLQIACFACSAYLFSPISTGYVFVLHGLSGLLCCTR